MKKYTVYFEIFGHKLKHTLIALNEGDAKNSIKAKIKFHKVKQENDSDIDKFEQLFKEIFK